MVVAESLIDCRTWATSACRSTWWKPTWSNEDWSGARMPGRSASNLGSLSMNSAMPVANAWAMNTTIASSPTMRMR